MRRSVLWLVLTICLLAVTSAFAQDAMTDMNAPGAAMAPVPDAGQNPPGMGAMPNGPMMQRMRQMMMMHMQDMMVMMQNTAVWTPQGLVVLQGNTLLHYSPELRLQHTITLPLPPAPPAMAPMAPPDGAAPGMAMPMNMPMMEVRSLIPAKILPNNEGLIIVRGKQLIRLDRNFQVIGQATLPDLPALTAAEIAALCPMCQQMMMMMNGMTMGRGMMGGGMMGGGMMGGGGMPGAPAQPTPMAPPPMTPQ